MGVKWNDGLSGPALNIAGMNHSPIRVMAGPGTGKSFAMKRRVARLLEEGQDPSRVLAVTFTRTAAEALVDDLHGLEIKGCEKVHATTLHSLCFALLSRQSVFDYLGRTPRPLVTFTSHGILQFEGLGLVADLAHAGGFGPKRECTKRIRAFEAAWARQQSEQPGWPLDPTDRRFAGVLTEWLRFHEALLIGELVPEALRYLRNNPNAPQLRAYDHVIVDEYQDLNRAEQDLVDLLARNGHQAIVGDVDQSIYRFRHANPEGITSFDQTHPQTHDEPLNECRRCPTTVVALADSLIQYNYPKGGSPRLVPLQGNPPGEVHLVQWQDVDEEARGIASFIEHLVTARGHAAGDILVLSPRRLLGYRIRDLVGEKGIAVHSYYTEEFIKGEKAQVGFAILNLLVTPEDRTALRWWLGHGDKAMRAKAYAPLREHCASTGESPNAALERLATKSLTIPGTDSLVVRFRELQLIRQALTGQPLQTVVDVLFPDTSEECAILRELAVGGLATAKTLADLWGHLKTQVTQPEVPEQGKFVRVMSLHKSKGLTSRAVIITSCIQGLIPYEDRDQPPTEQAETLAEQRRLFYVSITRAKELLLISSVAEMDRKLGYALGASLPRGRSSVAKTIASPFLSELGPSAPPARTGMDWAASAYQ